MEHQERLSSNRALSIIATWCSSIPLLGRYFWSTPHLSQSSLLIPAYPRFIHFSTSHDLPYGNSEPTKISRRFLEDGSKVRVSKKSGQIIPKPNPLANRKARSTLAGPKDTTPADVFEVTFTDYEKYLPFIYASHRASASTSASTDSNSSNQSNKET